MRRVLTCGIFLYLLSLLLNQHVYRLNLQNNYPSSAENNIEITYPEETPQNLATMESIEAETEWLKKQRDEDYIHQALQTEEPIEKQYVIAEEIEQGIDFPKQIPDKNLLASLPQLTGISSDEEDYSHYEEELPQDVVEETDSKKIRDGKEKRFSKPSDIKKQPVIAIVIDDMGDNYRRTRDISSLKAPLTASFLTYPKRLKQQISQSSQAGHEIMLHVPMQPKSNINMSTDILTIKMTPEEIKNRLSAMLKIVHTIKGINNHMGSLFTEDEKRMSAVMQVLKENGMFFLDSKTTPRSVGEKLAKKYDVDYASRNVFLDNKNELSYILGQLSKAEQIATKRGYAIAIGHPKSQTYEALKQWLPTLQSKKLKLVHLSEIIARLNSQASH